MAVISVIVPCFNEESNINAFYTETQRVSGFFPHDTELEYIFVNDGSTDNTLGVIKTLSEIDNRVKYVSFSRNFGKEAAIYAGLKKSSGDFAVIMDADLQDPPSLLPEMYKAVLEEGYESVATRRVDRKGEPPIRSFFARLFYKLMNKISDVELKDGARDYRFMTRKYVNALLSLSEYNRFSKGIFGWVGFKTKWLEFENVPRTGGETKWSFWKLFKYSLEGIVAFSYMPLYVSSLLGLILCAFSFVAIIFVVIRQLVFGGSAYGWPSLVCIILFIGGLIMLSVGILGFYLSKVYLEVKKRPVYITDEESAEE